MAPYNDQLYAQLYDEIVHDWPSEIDFYRQLIAETKSENVLEVACGTGRVLLKLARNGLQLTGIDLDPTLLEVARSKANGRPGVTLLQGDMRSFELDESFHLVTVPAHSFQFMLTPDDQINCLECIRRHLVPNGVLVVHLDHQKIDWLGNLTRDLDGVFEVQTEIAHPETGNTVRVSKAWSYDPSTQTASAITRWEQLDSNGKVIDQRESESTSLHCVFRFEMEHLLARAGFLVENVYGDFSRQKLNNNSPEMIWIARKLPSDSFSPITH
jgi:SAM-dependent methyltransferase